MIGKSSRYTGGLADIREDDDREARAKVRVSPARAVNCHSFRNGWREVGNMYDIGNCGATGRLEIGQTRGGKLKVGDKKTSEVQNALGLRGRKGKLKNPHVMDTLKPEERLRLYLEGAEAQGMGQTQGALEGPSPASLGESARPGGRIYQTNFWAARKGRSKEKKGMENPRWEEALECEMSAGENKGFQETNSSQNHGRSKGNNKKQVTSRKERYPTKDIAGSEEVDEGRYYGEWEQESPAGKLLGKSSFFVDTEDVGAKGGLQCAVVDSPGSVLWDAIQTGGRSKCLHRNPELITGDLRLEVEGEDDTRVGRRMRSGEEGVGNFDGTRPESSGRERHSRREVQEEMQRVSGHIIGVGRGSGTQGASGRELGRPTVSTPVLGLAYQAALCPVSSTRSLLNGLSLNEPTCCKVMVVVAEPGMCQELLSKPVEKPACLGPILCSSEEGQDGNVINFGTGDELRKAAVQEDSNIPMNRYDDNCYAQYSPIPISVFGRPLLLEGFSGQGVSVPDKSSVPLRVAATDDKDWGSPGAISDVGEENGEVGQRKTKSQCELLEN